MIASAIHELAGSKQSTRIAAAYFERTVQIWDLESQKKISEVPTVFCSGAGNLAIAPNGGMLVTGLSKVRGEVAAYEIPSGKRIWERRNLNYPSSLQFDVPGRFIECSINHSSVFRLNAYTGTDVEVMKLTSRYFEGSYGEALSVPVKGTSDTFRLIGKSRNFDIERLSFALLDAQFSPWSVCLSEASGPVRCISNDDGKMLWMYDPGEHKHVVRLHYSPKQEVFFGILRHLAKGGSSDLVRFPARNGGPAERVCSFASWGEAFVETKDQLVTSAGEIRDLSSGALVGRLDFPMREYPDDNAIHNETLNRAKLRH